MNTEITPDEGNTILMRAIDRAAIATCLARDGHSQTDSICRWAGDVDPEEAQAITDDCWTYMCAESALYDWSSEETLATDAETAAIAYITARRA